jgi:hypothetical protein
LIPDAILYEKEDTMGTSSWIYRAFVAHQHKSSNPCNEKGGREKDGMVCKIFNSLGKLCSSI